MVTYADKPWIKHYDKGVPASLQPYPEITIPDFLRMTARRYPKNTALITDAKLPVVGHTSHKITYRQLDDYSDALASALVDMGLQRGDRVAIVMPNVAPFVISYFAILKAGGVVVANNPLYPPQKMAKQIANSDAEIVLTLGMNYQAVKEIQPETRVRHVIVANVKDYLPRMARVLFAQTQEKQGGHYLEKVQPGDFWMQDLLKKYAGYKPGITITPDDLAMFQYTGGMTGVSKGAAATHRALVASTMMIMAWKSVDIPGFAPKPGHEQTTLAVLPLFHVYGLVVMVNMSIALGTRVLLVPNPRDVDTLVSMIDSYRPDVLGAVPLLYHALLNHPDVRSGKVQFDSIRVAQSGAAPLHPSIRRDFETIGGGKRLCEGFGMSEIPCGTHSLPFAGESRDKSVGLPLPDVECAVVSLDDEETEVPVGELGEIVIHAPHMMLGYHKMPEETAHVLHRREDGRLWVYTGDIGRMDEDGYFYLVGRKKNMVLAGGFNVYPVQVESVLRMHPAVKDVFVKGETHPKIAGEESLRAWVVLEPGQKASKGDLISHCKTHLAGYEVPRSYTFVQELPQTEPEMFFWDFAEEIEKAEATQEMIAEPVMVRQ